MSRSAGCELPLFSSDTKFHSGTPTYRHRALLITPFKDQRKNRF
jgi:peptide methionine sulfoxide reductase MsrB